MKQSSHKAWTAAVATLVLALLGRFTGAVEAPPIAEIEGAIRVLVEVVIAPLAVGGAAWFVPNKPKAGKLGALILAPLLLLGATACEQLRPATTVAETPAQTVYAVTADYTALLAAALAYESLPRCDVAPPPCSETEVVERIRQADDDAAIALDEAQTAVRDPAIEGDAVAAAIRGAEGAVAAFRGVLRNHNLLEADR